MKMARYIGPDGGVEIEGKELMNGEHVPDDDGHLAAEHYLFEAVDEAPAPVADEEDEE